MGLFDKLKNVFIEEDFEDDVPVVKEEVKVETSNNTAKPKIANRNIATAIILSIP